MKAWHEASTSDSCSLELKRNSKVAYKDTSFPRYQAVSDDVQVLDCSRIAAHCTHILVAADLLGAFKVYLASILMKCILEQVYLDSHTFS